jgi:NADPH2:quinone reductase
MRAARVVRHAEPAEAVVVEEVEPPEPGPGQVRVAVSAASLNFGDIARCRGGVAAVMALPPFTLGMDVCGTVDAAGPGAEEWLGRRVVGTTPQSLGGLAEHALAGSWWAAPPELNVVVRGGASAVGTAAIQLAVAAGARVLAVAGGPEKAALCRDLGAASTIDHTTDDVFEMVMDETGDRGADVIFDPIGGEQTETLWTCGALGGRYLAVGFNDDPQSGLTGRALRTLSMANLTVMGVLLAYLDTPRDFRRFGINGFPPDVGQAVHAHLLELVAAGSVRPVIGRTIVLDEVGDALEDHAARRTSGRTVVDLSAGGEGR